MQVKQTDILKTHAQWYHWIDSEKKLHQGIVLQWMTKNIGFGELTIGEMDGTPFIDTENMNTDFVLEILRHWITSIEART